MLQKNLTFSRTRKGVQESLHPFWYRSIMKNCADLQLEIDKKCIKNLFFDIDGTLTDRATGEIVPSAKEALQRLEENGHFVAIATGRAHYKAENFTLAMAGVLSWMIQKMFI